MLNVHKRRKVCDFCHTDIEQDAPWKRHRILTAHLSCWDAFRERDKKPPEPDRKKCGALVRNMRTLSIRWESGPR